MLLNFINNYENLEAVLTFMKQTTDFECTLFIAIELLNKSYMVNASIGANNSTII